MSSMCAPQAHAAPPIFGPGSQWQCSRGGHFMVCPGRSERFLQGQQRLWGLTHIVTWIYVFHLGLTEPGVDLAPVPRYLAV